MAHPAFQSGRYDTHFVQNYYDKRGGDGSVPSDGTSVTNEAVEALISALIHRDGGSGVGGPSGASAGTMDAGHGEVGGSFDVAGASSQRSGTRAFGSGKAGSGWWSSRK